MAEDPNLAAAAGAIYAHETNRAAEIDADEVMAKLRPQLAEKSNLVRWVVIRQLTDDAIKQQRREVLAAQEYSERQGALDQRTNPPAERADGV